LLANSDIVHGHNLCFFMFWWTGRAGLGNSQKITSLESASPFSRPCPHPLADLVHKKRSTRCREIQFFAVFVCLDFRALTLAKPSSNSVRFCLYQTPFFRPTSMLVTSFTPVFSLVSVSVHVNSAPVTLLDQGMGQLLIEAWHPAPGSYEPQKTYGSLPCPSVLRRTR